MVHTNNRSCYICHKSEDDEPTEYELRFKIALRWIKEYINGKWTGNYICSRCKSREYARQRAKHLR